MRPARRLRDPPGTATLLLPPPSGLGVAGPGALVALLASGFITSPGCGAAGWWPRRKPATSPPPEFPFTVEDCVRAADRAIGEERWPLAAEWLHRAHRLAPGSTRIAVDLAFALRQLGDLEGALRLYGETGRHAGPHQGEALFHGGLTALAAGRPPEEAEAWLLRALAVEPQLAFVMDGHELDPLRPRAAFRVALQKARRVASAGDGRGH